MRRKRIIGIRSLTILLSAALIIVSCSKQETAQTAEPTESGPNQSQNGGAATKDTLLHYILPEGHEHRLIGDVHPFYDAKSETWYMFYLDTSGQFHTKLLTSKDAISWEPTELLFKGNTQNYAALGIVESEGKYFSYYAEYLVSMSDNLTDWTYPGIKYLIPQNTTQFPGGMRDPYVTYDPESKRYYSIALSYPKRVPSENIYISNLAINQSNGDSLQGWGTAFKTVFAENFESHDPEVPQLVKIDDRWYVITSIYGNSIHGVGGTNYLIGDPGKNPYEVDWHTKTLHTLTSEDLSAAQLVAFGDRHLLFGWIPKDYTGNTWGGHINLALEVFAHEDGTLGTKIYDGISELIRGEQSYVLEAPVTITKDTPFEFPALKRMDMELDFQMSGDLLKLRFADKKVEILVHNEGEDSSLEIKSDVITTSTLKIGAEALTGANKLRVISEGNMLEVFLNDAYTIHSRVGLNFGEDKMTLSASGQVELNQLSTYKLKFLEEL